MRNKRMDCFRQGRWIVIVLLLGVLLCGVSGALALGLGLVVAQLGYNREPEFWSYWAHRLLQISIVGLGAGIDLPTVARAGMDGFGITFVSICLILIGGHFLTRLWRVPADTGLLVCAGTAICGGSAIAALSGVLRPHSRHTATAFGVVFALNAVALVLFPYVGHVFHLTEPVFGWWAALAIHDTSSVVGAGSAYGQEALILATTVKLARSLWIMPVACVLAYFRSRGQLKETKEGAIKLAIPWFIVGFVAMAALVWLLPGLKPAGQMLFHGSQRFLACALFLIGLGMVPALLRQVGWRPLALGISLWLPTAIGSLCVLLLVHPV